MSRIIVIGGGAAGMLSAIVASQNGAEVIILEKNKRVGRKICITGKGRCNVTNNCSENEFIEHVVTNPRFLYSAINAFSTSDTMNFFEEAGVPLKTERGNRVFPQSDKALDISNALERTLKRQKVSIFSETVAKEIVTENGRILGVKDNKGSFYEADAVILATGGKSYPLTGSTGDGYKMAEKLGHTIITPTPSLIPLECKGEELKDCISMQGLSLRNVGVKLFSDNKVLYSDFGELLFTHFGLSGPTILSSSTRVKDLNTNRYTVSIDMKPALDFDTLDLRLQKDLDKNKNKELRNSLSGLLPLSMIPVFLRRLKFPEDLRCNSVTREQRHRLLELLKNLTFEISGVRPIDEAIVTRGGVSVSEVNPKTMESKLINGLYFCGEVLDVDAYTGGFNLQIAFSTGYLAGQSAAWNT